MDFIKEFVDAEVFFKPVHMIPVRGAYGCVLMVALASFFVLMHLAGKVMKARKQYNVEYPDMYAVEGVHKNAKAFNCVQRAHQNALETYPFWLFVLLVGGIPFPILSSVFGVIFLAGKYAYACGYATGNPAKRSWGFFGYIGLLGHLVCVVIFAVMLVMGKYKPT